MLNMLIHMNLMPFHLSLCLFLLLGMAESLGRYLHTPPSQWLKSFIPSHLDAHPLFRMKFSKFFLILFFLLNFACAGYVLQLAIFAQYEQFVAAYYVLIPAVILAVFMTAFMSHCLDQILPPPRSTPHNQDLLGYLATVSSGNAKPSFPAQARVRDDFGTLHYVTVEPEFGELEVHSAVILIRMKRNHYIAKKVAPSQPPLDAAP